MNAKLNKHQLDALEQQGQVGNTALADALRKVVDAKQVVFKSSVAPTLTVVPTPESKVQEPVNIIPDVTNIPATSLQAPAVNVPAPSISHVHKWNITIWTIIIDDRESRGLVKHVTKLLRKNEIPMFAISLKEDGGKTILALRGELIDGDTAVKFKVIDGNGRLFKDFPKNTVFFSGELSGSVIPDPCRQDIVAKFKVEINTLLHQMNIALRSKLKNLQS